MRGEILRVGLLSLLVLLAGSWACSRQEEGTPCLEDCELCADYECPPERCGLLVIMSQDCEGKVDFAEIAVDNCVEDEMLEPATSVRTCATLKRHQKRVLIARSAGWVWKETVECTPESCGGVIPVSLYCIDQNE